MVEHSSRTAVLSWSQSASPADQDSNVLDYILWYKDASGNFLKLYVTLILYYFLRNLSNFVVYCTIENWSEQTNKKSASGDKNSIVVTG